jgi:hypothetical protein
MRPVRSLALAAISFVSTALALAVRSGSLCPHPFA